MSKKKSLIVLIALLLGGCLNDQGASIDISGRTQRKNRSSEKDAGKPRPVCETTSIAGEPKSFCY